MDTNLCDGLLFVLAVYSCICVDLTWRIHQNKILKSFVYQQPGGKWPFSPPPPMPWKRSYSPILLVRRTGISNPVMHLLKGGHFLALFLENRPFVFSKVFIEWRGKYINTVMYIRKRKENLSLSLVQIGWKEKLAFINSSYIFYFQKYTEDTN